MGSNSKCAKACIDRISGFPDSILCHILSFISTKDAVKTSVLSHRWYNVWASVPNLDFSTLESSSKFDAFAGFVDRVLSYRGSSNIHKFRLHWTGCDADFSRIDPWIYTAVKRNVVELELDFDVELTAYGYPSYELPRRLLKCNTLVVLKLTLPYNDIIITPNSDCFPSLKFLHVKLRYSEGKSIEKLFSFCPVLEDLIIEGDLEDYPVLNINISAPKLKRLRISLNLDLFGFDGLEDYKRLKYNRRRIFFRVESPSLEELDLRDNFLASYSLNNAKSLSKAKINLEDLHVINDPKFFRDAANRIHRLFAGILSVTYLSISAPIFEDLIDLYTLSFMEDLFTQNQNHLPTLNNLNHLELHLQTCCSWLFLTKLLTISPNLEHLVLVIHGDWSPQRFEGVSPDVVPICLLSRLKTICIPGFFALPDQIELAKYFLKHCEELNMVKICPSHFCTKEETKLLQKLAMFPRASSTCQIEFPEIKF